MSQNKRDEMAEEFVRMYGEYGYVSEFSYQKGWDSALKHAPEVQALCEALEIAIPIVEAAFWDHYSAGNIPGAGYSHKVYNKISDAFGWRSKGLGGNAEEKFNAFKAKLTKYRESVRTK